MPTPTGRFRIRRVGTHSTQSKVLAKEWASSKNGFPRSRVTPRVSVRVSKEDFRPKEVRKDRAQDSRGGKADMTPKDMAKEKVLRFMVRATNAD